MSIAAIKSAIGVPVNESKSGREVTLFYPPWQVEFQGGGFTRSVREDTVRRGIVGNDDGVDVKVLSLNPGQTIKRVEMDLGAPDEVQDVFEGSRVPFRVLWYGPWELQFRHRKLTHREKR